jgi:hypothetical protein
MFVVSIQSQKSFESGPSITQTSEKEEKIFCLLLMFPRVPFFLPLLLPHCLVTYSGEMKIDEASHNF